MCSMFHVAVNAAVVQRFQFDMITDIPSFLHTSPGNQELYVVFKQCHSQPAGSYRNKITDVATNIGMTGVDAKQMLKLFGVYMLT